MLSTLAPAVDDASDLKPVMTMSLWCTCYSITIILFRVMGRWLRTKTVFVEDVIMALSILILVARITLVSRVLYYGTNNVDYSVLTETDVQHREVGSQLVLVTRMLYALYLWIVKLSVGIYLMRLIDQFWAAKALLSKSSGGRFFKTFLSKYINCMLYASLILSFIGVVVSELVECRPFPHYWQVVPDPGTSCRQSYGQLFTMGGLNILTDIILIALPLPLIIEAKLTRKVKLESMALMLFPLVNIAFTAYRLPNTVSAGHLGSQRYRTLMASLDILLSTAAANALVVTSFLQGRGFKKTTTYRDPKLLALLDEESSLERKVTVERQRQRQRHSHPHPHPHRIGGEGEGEGEPGLELSTLSPTAGLRLSTRSSSSREDRQHHHHAPVAGPRRYWGMMDEDLMRGDDSILGDSPPASLTSRRRVTWMSGVATLPVDVSSGYNGYNGGGGGPPATDDCCSERSTTRLSPYPQAQTTISTDKAAAAALARAREEEEESSAAAASAASDMVGGQIAIPPRARRSSMTRGIVVETTWHVDVSSFSRPR